MLSYHGYDRDKPLCCKGLTRKENKSNFMAGRASRGKAVGDIRFTVIKLDQRSICANNTIR